MSSIQKIINLPRKNKMIPKTNISIKNHHKAQELWKFYELELCYFININSDDLWRNFLKNFIENFHWYFIKHTSVFCKSSSFSLKTESSAIHWLLTGSLSVHWYWISVTRFLTNWISITLISGFLYFCFVLQFRFNLHFPCQQNGNIIFYWKRDCCDSWCSLDNRWNFNNNFLPLLTVMKKPMVICCRKTLFLNHQSGSTIIALSASLLLRSPNYRYDASTNSTQISLKIKLFSPRFFKYHFTNSWKLDLLCSNL